MGVLDGQVAFITGASRGVGRAIAEAFAREGAAVVAAGRSMEFVTALRDQIRASGGRAEAVEMDVKSQDSIRAAISQAVSSAGPIDVLVNNAGVIALHEVADTPTEVWDDVMSTNVRGVFLTCREVLPSMIKRGNGRIINIGSMAGRRGYVQQGAYCASKHALVGLSKVMALEAASSGVRVHMLSPGGVLTDLSSDLRASRGEPDDSPEWMTCEEVAAAAVYLCTQNGAAMTDELVLRRFASDPWR